MPASAASSAPIGVYDSGFGGLHVLKALKAMLPSEPFVYVADSGNAPYGDRHPVFFSGRATEVARFLVQLNTKALVLACNTASVVAARQLRALHSMPIVAMEPAIRPAARASKSKVVLVLATTNTVRSQSVARLCQAYGADVRLILQPCPGLSDLVERGEFHSDKTRALLRQYLRPGLAAGADVVVLGCTHYAYLGEEIALMAGPSVAVVEPSSAVARQLSHLLKTSAAASPQQAAKTSFYTSGCPQEMASFLALVGEPFDQVNVLP